MATFPLPIRPGSDALRVRARRWPLPGVQLLARRLGGCAVLAAPYASLTVLESRVDAFGQADTAMWVPTGLAVGALVRWGSWLWPGVAAGALSGFLLAGHPPPAAGLMALGAVLEVVIAVALLRRVRFGADLARLRDVAALVVIAALAATAVGASIGTLGLYLRDGGIDSTVTWSAWWLADAVGTLLLAPLVLAGGDTLRTLRTRPGDALLVVGPLLAVLMLAVGLALIGRSERFLTWMLLQAFVGAAAVIALVAGAAIRERARALALRGEFIAIAAHELRTPLAALFLRIDAARLALGEPAGEPTSLQRGLRSASIQVRRLARLVDGLLDASRLDGRGLGLEPVPMDLVPAIREVLAEVRDELDAAGCPVEVAIPERAPGRWDRPRLQRMLVNLLACAARHGRGQPLRLEVQSDVRLTRIAVVARGASIDPRTRARLLDPFDGEEGERDHADIGLSPYIARAVAVAHGGSLRLHDSTPTGCSFVVELPTSPPVS